MQLSTITSQTPKAVQNELDEMRSQADAQLKGMVAKLTGRHNMPDLEIQTTPHALEQTSLMQSPTLSLPLQSKHVRQQMNGVGPPIKTAEKHPSTPAKLHPSTPTLQLLNTQTINPSRDMSHAQAPGKHRHPGRKTKRYFGGPFLLRWTPNLAYYKRGVMPRPRADHQMRRSFLVPSLRRNGEVSTGEVGPWRELAMDSAVTTMKFGSSQIRNDLVLAVAFQRGTVGIFSISKTLFDHDEPGPGPDAELMQLFSAHERAVTSVYFCANDEELLTGSTDCTVRLWHLQDARLLREIVLSTPVTCALPLKANRASSLVIACVSPMLRLAVDGVVRRSVCLDHDISAIAIAPNSSRLLAGTRGGTIHALTLKGDELYHASRAQFARETVTCLTIAPVANGMTQFVLASLLDGTTCVMEANAKLTNLTMLRRLPGPDGWLTGRCMHGLAPGLVVSACSDSTVRIFDVANATECRFHAHTVPVSDVAVAHDSTLLASGDVNGSIILWRRGCPRAGV